MPWSQDTLRKRPQNNWEKPIFLLGSVPAAGMASPVQSLLTQMLPDPAAWLSAKPYVGFNWGGAGAGSGERLPLVEEEVWTAAMGDYAGQTFPHPECTRVHAVPAPWGLWGHVGQQDLAGLAEEILPALPTVSPWALPQSLCAGR